MISPGTYAGEEMPVRKASTSRDLRILKTIAESLNAASSVDEALQPTLDRVAKLLGLKTGWIWLADEQTGKFYGAVAQGLVVVGVHTPEYDFERVGANVRTAVERLGIRYPVVLDNDYRIWNAWGNQFWPALYLIDRQGRIVYHHFGEGSYARTEAEIRAQLSTAPAAISY